MEQELEELLIDRPDSLQELLVLLGAQTCPNVIGLWLSSHNLIEELEREIGAMALWRGRLLDSGVRPGVQFQGPEAQFQSGGHV